MPRAVALACCLTLAAVALAPPAAAAPDPDCVVRLVVAGIPQPADLLACGFVGSQGFLVLFSSGVVPGILSDPWTALVAAPPGWTCTSGGNPVAPGDELADANPSVSCLPPPASLPLDCQKVGAEFLSTHALAGTASATASCGSLSATSIYSAPASPGTYTTATGSDAFPFQCAVDDSAAGPTGSWMAWCDVNVP